MTVGVGVVVREGNTLGAGAEVGIAEVEEAGMEGGGKPEL